SCSFPIDRWGAILTAELFADNGQLARRKWCRFSLGSGLRIGRIGFDRVVAGTSVHHLVRRAIDGIELVVAIITEELIGPESADDAVIADAAVQHVSAAAADWSVGS